MQFKSAKYSPLLHPFGPIIISPSFVQPEKRLPLNVGVPEYPFAVSHVMVEIISHEHFVTYLVVLPGTGSGHPVYGIFVVCVAPSLVMYPVGRVTCPWQVSQMLLHVVLSSVTFSLSIIGQVFSVAWKAHSSVGFLTAYKLCGIVVAMTISVMVNILFIFCIPSLSIKQNRHRQAVGD